MLVFRGVYFSADSFPGDFGATHYGQVAYWIASVTAGQWPSWIPYPGMGYPFAVNPETGILYPPLWVFPALHLPYTLKAASIVEALHIYAGAVGAYALSRRLFGAPGVALIVGVAYLAYGGFYSNAAHPDIVRAFALLPWLLWAFVLLPDRLQSCSARRWGASALSATALFAPLVVYLLVTGAYPGNVIAFFWVLAALVVVQAARNFYTGQPLGASIFDALALFALLGLGVLMTSAFLVPIVAASHQLTRVAGGPLSANVMHYLQPRDLYELVLPNSYLHARDNEMYGMQLPLALLPFVAFVSRRMVELLAPFIVVVAISLFMALDMMSGTSSPLAQQIPILGLSRFPSGDYRTCIALGVLLILAAGLREAMTRWREAETAGTERESPARSQMRGAGRERWRRADLTPAKLAARRYLIGLAVVVDVASTAFLQDHDPASTQSAISLLVLQLIPAAVVAALLLFERRRWFPSIAPLAIAPLCFLSALPILLEAHANWQVPEAEKYLIDDSGVNLWPDGQWLPNRVVQQSLSARPARDTRRRYPNDISWHGYLRGDFLMADYGGVVLVVSRVVQRNPQLRAFMQRASTLVAIPCSSSECGDGHIAHASLSEDSQAFEWNLTEYARSSLRYNLSLHEPSLVVENEPYAEGWTARIDHGETSILPIKVNEALRGWLLPPGEHELTVAFETPLLGLGVACSALAVVAYGLILATAARRSLMRGTTACAIRRLPSGV